MKGVSVRRIQSREKMDNGYKKFGLRDKIGYLFGDFGNDFTFILSSSFLLKFYTDVMGVSAAAVGFVMMFARFADAFTDIAMGRICDRGRGNYEFDVANQQQQVNLNHGFSGCVYL